LTLAPAITSTYSIVNAVDNYSQGLRCHSINGQNVALSSSTFVGASGSAAFTYSSWINISTSSTNHFKNLFYVAASKGGGQKSVEIKMDASGHLTFTKYGIDAGGYSANSTIQITDFQTQYSGSWIHLATVCGADYTAYGNSKFYINGASASVSVESRGTGGTAHTISGAVFVMSNGDQADSNYYPFQGKYDEISYWKSELSAAQIKTLYNCGTRFSLTSDRAGIYLPTASLTSWWTFDESAITGSMHTGFTITDHAATFGANTLTVKDKYQEAGNDALLTPVSGVINAKPMALFSLKTAANTATYNGETADGITAGFVTSSVTDIESGSFAYLNCTSSFSGTLSFAGGIDDVLESRNLHSINDSLIGGSKNRTIITSRFSSPGGIEVQSKGYLDAYSHEYSVHNALPFRNLTVRGSGSGESGTIRVVDIHGNRSGLKTHLQRHSGKFGSDSGIGSVTSTDYVTVPSFHKIPRNISRKPTDQTELSAPVLNEDHDNAFIQRPIPQSDFQYSWITASIGSNYSVLSGKQRIYGYAPRGGEVVKGPSEYYMGSFNESDSSYVAIGSETVWNPLVGTANSNNKMTVTAWIRAFGGSNNHFIINFSDQMYFFVNNSSKQLEIGADWSGSPNARWRTLGEGAVPNALLMHVAMTYNYSNAVFKPVIYINGIAQFVEQVTAAAGSFSGVPSGTSYIGRYASSAYFAGQISNVGIWSNALSAAEILRIYNAGVSPTEALSMETDLAAYYQFTRSDQGLGKDTSTQILDRSGNGRNSTAVNNVSIVREESATLVEALVFPSASEIFGIEPA